MGTDAKGVEPDPQFLRKALALGDSIFFLEIAKDQATLVGGQPIEAFPEAGEMRVDFQLRFGMVESGEGIERLVSASDHTAHLQGHPVGHAPEVTEGPLDVDHRALRQPQGDPVDRLVGQALRVNTELPSLEECDEPTSDVLVEGAGLLTVGGKAPEK